jgi:hypothetical protein
MRKKTSMTMALTIVTILTTYIAALTLSNQAFAQSVFSQLGQKIFFAGNPQTGHSGLLGQIPDPNNPSGQIIQAQLGKISGSHPEDRAQLGITGNNAISGNDNIESSNSGHVGHSGLLGQAYPIDVCKLVDDIRQHMTKQFGITIPPALSLRFGLDCLPK